MTSSERPSPEPLLRKEASPAVLGGREFWKCSGGFKCLELGGLGHPSRTLKRNSRKSSESVSGIFPEFFQNFFGKSQPYWGYGLNCAPRPSRREAVGTFSNLVLRLAGLLQNGKQAEN